MSVELLLEAVPGCAALVDPQGRILKVNLAWADSLPGNPFLEGQGPGSDYLQRCQDLCQSKDGHVSLVATGLRSSLQGKLKRLKLEYPVPGDPEPRWYSMTASIGPLDAGIGTVVAHLDITERMRWETRWKRGEQLFKATTENALDLLAILTANGQVLYASPSYDKTLGLVSGTLVSWKLLDMVDPEDRSLFQEQCRAAFRLGLSPLFEYRVLHRDGTVRHLEARAVAVENPGGNRESILLNSRDVSAKKEAEAQRARMELELRHAQKMEAIGQLAAGIAHEINTPCQYLSDNMGFLAEAFDSIGAVLAPLGPGAEPAPPERELAELRDRMAREDVAYLLEEVPRAIAQSRDGLSRISTIVKAMKVFGHPGGEGRAAVDLNEALQNTLVVAQSEWKYVAEVSTDLDPALPSVVCSLGELNQVFLNLIVNAAQAIGERGLPEKGRISITTRSLEQGVEIRIRDTGAGIPEAIRERIFLPFFTTKPVGKGTGQGLSIAHSVIARHGGTLRFESVLDQGTCFIISLPLSS